jgi:hypothetical protein
VVSDEWVPEFLGVCIFREPYSPFTTHHSPSRLWLDAPTLFACREQVYSIFAFSNLLLVNFINPINKENRTL